MFLFFPSEANRFESKLYCMSTYKNEKFILIMLGKNL